MLENLIILWLVMEDIKSLLKITSSETTKLRSLNYVPTSIMFIFFINSPIEEKLKRNMKVHLHRVYDCVDREFLSMILYKNGFLHKHVKWIISSITSTSMVFLINGVPTHFFKIYRGLR